MRAVDIEKVERIDGCVNEKDILENWRKKFQELGKLKQGEELVGNKEEWNGEYAVVDSWQIINVLKSVSVGKARGPDGISGDQIKWGEVNYGVGA